MMRNCEACGRPHSGAYASGRFCDSVCSRSFSTRAKRKEINQKVSAKLKGTGPFGASNSPSTREKYKETCRKKRVGTLKRKKEKHLLTPENHARRVEGSRKGGEVWRVYWHQKMIREPFDTLSIKLKRKRVKHEQAYRCLWCSRSEWRGLPIVLEVDHINGVKADNSRENLRALCHNCHSQTPTWKGKNTRKAIHRKHQVAKIAKARLELVQVET